MDIVLKDIQYFMGYDNKVSDVLVRGEFLLGIP